MGLPEDFKEALSCWASGVSVVATRVDGNCYALTVSSFASLSLDPPLILVCLANNNRMPSMVQTAGAFTVSILARGQDEISGECARAGREPAPQLPGVPLADTPSARPAVVGAVAWLDCDLHEALDGGDHTIVIGRVQHALSWPERPPLVYHRRAYRSVAD